MRLSGKSVRWLRYGAIGLGVLVSVVIGIPLWGQVPYPLPSPEEVLQQAEQVTSSDLPTQLVSWEIDEITRDRLRFDPQWRPILEAVQLDIMALKWGNGHLQNPVWQRYGEKAYPVLDYYTRTADPTRQAYGLLGIRSLGQPYTTLWLERQLQRRLTQFDFYWMTASSGELFNREANETNLSFDWQKAFGLNDPATRDRLIQLARQHLEPANSPTYYDQFNLQFLAALQGREAIISPYRAMDDKPAPAILDWEALESLAQPTPDQRQQAIAYYQHQSSEVQDYILVGRLGAMKAGKITPVGKALLQSLADDSNAADRVWAIAELDRHGDSQGRQRLQAILNGDLTQLYSLTKQVRYENGFLTPSWADRATHAYYLLLGIVSQYPDTRFAEAAQTYGNLTGRSYFGGELRSALLRDRLAKKTSSQKAAGWQDWLTRYPDHPGADDATYFLARSLQDQNQPLAAIERWVALMTTPIGDGDAKYLAYPHLRVLLDVGLSIQQLQTLVQRYDGQPIASLFQYALAVHYARAQNYTKALQLSDGLDLADLPDSVLGSYYSDRWWGELHQPQQVQQRIQSVLADQRQRWQKLQQLQVADTPDADYQLASNWAGAGGWKNGYLALWDDTRTYTLPVGDWGDYYCQYYWVCNTELRNQEVVRQSYQAASQNAIALSLYQDLLDDPELPSSLREKTLYMAASTLLWQWEDHPLGETLQIHPLFGMMASNLPPLPPINADDTASYDRYAQAWQARYDQVNRDYLNYLDQTLTRLKQQFPRSPYIDDLLFSRYAMSGQVQFLKQIVEHYPNGDRSAEAWFLLAQRSINAT